MQKEQYKMEDYRKYLSYDNQKGILLNNQDKSILDKYKIDYNKLSSLKDLIIEINEFLEDNYYEDLEDLEIVLSNLEETYYYTQVNK